MQNNTLLNTSKENNIDGLNRKKRLFVTWCIKQIQHLIKNDESLKTIDIIESYAAGNITESELIAANGRTRSYAHYIGTMYNRSHSHIDRISYGRYHYAALALVHASDSDSTLDINIVSSYTAIAIGNEVAHNYYKTYDYL